MFIAPQRYGLFKKSIKKDLKLFTINCNKVIYQLEKLFFKLP